MNNAVFGKTVENVRKHRDIELVTTERRRNYLVSEPNYYTTKLFTENLLAIEIRKTQISMNKSVYSGLSIIKSEQNRKVWILVWLCKTKVWWKCKTLLNGYRELIIHVKTDDIYKDIVEDVETRFGTLNFKLDRPLS